jgi:orotidine-5'-phosphate decarboxylase
MGSDSVKPFLSYPDKWVILLALTSNQGAFDFQFREDASGDPLYKQVIRTSLEWADEDQMMYVVGATQASMLQSIRQLIPEHFLLVPGVGAQGGSLDEVVQYGMNQTCGLLINSSRQVLYAGKDVDFALSARKEATYIQQQMASYLKR